MTRYLAPVDIANRGLQHCGVDLMDAAAGFTEESDRAEQTSFVYDKLRRAELRRNLWEFALKYCILRPVDTTSRLLSPELWASTTQYTIGDVVTDSTGSIWVSLANQNLNQEPGSVSSWELYFGPMAIPRFDTTGTVSYYAGEVVYTTNLDGTYTVYMSRINANADVPGTVTTWDTDTEYGVDAIVTYSAVRYQSLIDFNEGQTPSASAAAWAVGTSYSAGDHVTGSDGFRYTSVTNSNVGNDPTLDGGTNWTNTGTLTPWTIATTRGNSADSWLVLGATLMPLALVYPVGAGPVSQQGTRNLYRFPANHLRKAPQAPKAGINSFLGAPTGVPEDDWEISGQYIVTNQVGPFAYRFIGDVTDVRSMDDMFCEGLGARIGYEVCPKLTQSVSKRTDIAAAYKTFMGEARVVSGNVQGAVEPPEDEYLAVRA